MYENLTQKAPLILVLYIPSPSMIILLALFDTSVTSTEGFGEFLGVLKSKIWLELMPGQ